MSYKSEGLCFRGLQRDSFESDSDYIEMLELGISRSWMADKWLGEDIARTNRYFANLGRIIVQRPDVSTLEDIVKSISVELEALQAQHKLTFDSNYSIKEGKKS